MGKSILKKIEQIQINDNKRLKNETTQQSLFKLFEQVKEDIRKSNIFYTTELKQKIPTANIELIRAENFIFFSGTKIDDRYAILFRDKPIFLTFSCFRIFFIMASAAWLRLFFPVSLADDSIDIMFLDSNGNGSRYLYRLKQEIIESGVWPDDLWINNRAGAYRSAIDGKYFAFDYKQLTSLDDITITNIANHIESLISSQTITDASTMFRNTETRPHAN